MKEHKISDNIGNQLSTDWQEVYKRLELAQQTIEHGIIRTREENKKILRDRAVILAREPEKEDDDDKEHIEVIEFILAYETYCIESSYVSEIYPLSEITPLPGTPPFVLGIVNIHGQILSIIDLKNFFELPEKGLTDLNKIIIIRNDTMEFGILADVVLGIRKLAIAEIEAVLPTLTGIRTQYLKGVTRERMAILNAIKILSDENITISEGRQTK